MFHVDRERALNKILLEDELRKGKAEAINHPAHYGGKDNPYEAIKVIEAWELDFCTGNTVKYISRAGKKDPSKRIEDLKKGRWYLDRLIQRLEQEQGKR